MTRHPDQGTPRLLHVFPSFAAGGAQIRMVQLANAMGRTMRHAVVALDGDTSCRGRFDPAVDVTLLPTPDRSVSLPRRLRAIRRQVQAAEADLLVTSNWGAMEWALANRLPRLRHLHTEDGFGQEEQDRQLRRRVLFRRFALARSTVVVPSRTLERIATGQWRLAPQRLRYVPNGIDLQRFAPGARTPGGTPVLGCVAALRPEKNLARLLHAAHRAAATQALRLLIVGDGPERNRLEALAAELGLQARFTGTVADPAPLYRQMDLFCMASDTEQMPISVLEAMASGLMVVATDVGDIAEMVAPENRAYLAPKSAQALAGAIGAALADPATRITVGAANRAKAEAEFDQAVMIARWRRIFEAALGR